MIKFAKEKCGGANNKPMRSLSQQTIGTAPDGKEAQHYRLKSSTGIELELLSWGATISRLRTPDKLGQLGDVILGFADPRDYFLRHPYFGSTIGRFANRIGSAQFALQGALLELSRNEGIHHLHGGHRGFDKVSWRGEPFSKSGQPAVRFRYYSPDGEEGYPGELDVSVEYVLAERDIHITYEATSSKPTIINLTNHCYFNLLNGGSSDIWNHELLIPAAYTTAIDDQNIPTGQLKAVKDTALDFTSLSRMAERRDQLHEQRLYFDDNYVLNGPREKMKLAAGVCERQTGRKLEVWTTQAGLQFYSGEFIVCDRPGFGGFPYKASSGFCLEAQNFPDAPNHDDFPSATLQPGYRYQQEIIYKFPSNC